MDFTAFCHQLATLHLTGDLNRNTPESNRQAIREYIAHNDYWTFGASDIDQRDYDELAGIMAASLGMSPERFASNKAPYIEPEMTARGLLELRHRLARAAAANELVIFATNHPGSLLGFYLVLIADFKAKGGRLLTLIEPMPAPDRRWLDDVGGVIMLSDEGNLMHAHMGNGFSELVREHKPAFVVADHGFAIDAINVAIPTIAIHDVDDPALPIAANRWPDRVFAIPMNDNQTNVRSAAAAVALLQVDPNA
jgi:hypothetical protein